MKILVAEDDLETSAYVAQGLRELGHTLDVAHDGRDALMLAADGTYDVLILDRMMPGMAGIALIKALRAMEVTTPAIFLTALDGVGDRVQGLEAGGDDYLVKPFAFSELKARLAALARRPRQIAADTELAAGPVKMDLLARRVTRAGEVVELHPQEFKLLEYLLRHAGKVVTRTMLLEGVWGFHFDPKTSVVETHMSRLRAKIERPGSPPLIRTIRGSGYIIDG